MARLRLRSGRHMLGRAVSRRKLYSVERMLLVVVIYFGVGIAFYVNVEDRPADDCRESAHAQAGPVNGTSGTSDGTCHRVRWSVTDAVYFSMVSMSTVGYGDLAPSTTASRVFTIFYILVGVTYVFYRLSLSVEGLLLKINRRFLKYWTDDLVAGTPTSAAVGDESPGNWQVDLVLPPSAFVFWSLNLALPVLMMVLIQFAFALILLAVQPGLDFDHAIYHAFVTASVSAAASPCSPTLPVGRDPPPAPSPRGRAVPAAPSMAPRHQWRTAFLSLLLPAPVALSRWSDATARASVRLPR